MAAGICDRNAILNRENNRPDRFIWFRNRRTWVCISFELGNLGHYVSIVFVFLRTNVRTLLRIPLSSHHPRRECVHSYSHCLDRRGTARIARPLLQFLADRAVRETTSFERSPYICRPHRRITALSRRSRSIQAQFRSPRCLVVRAPV